MFEFANPTTHRRGFLGRLAGALAVAVTGVPAPLTATTPGARQREHEDPQLEAWFNKMTGQHRIVFDAPEPNGGMPAIFPRVYLNTMNSTYGTTDADNTAVLVLRHEGIPLGLEDAAWAKYELGKAFDIKENGAPATRNIYADITGMPIAGLGVKPLLKAGVLVGICNVALTVTAGSLAKAHGGTADAVKADLVANLIPGIQILPSGVMGVGRSQEKGCGYCFAG